MKQYVVSVIIAAVIGSLVCLLAPSGERGDLASHVRLTVGLVLILVCVSPLVDLLGEISELDISGIAIGEEILGKEEYESIFNESYSAAEVENLKEGIKTILKERFEIEADECYVSVTCVQDNDGKRRVSRIFINLYGKAIFKNTDEIEGYLSSLFGCETVTAVG